MSIDLTSSDGRKKYLTDKLDNLLDGINESYGSMLLEELIKRLETTIHEFNEEMNSLYEQLVKQEKERQHILEMMKSGSVADAKTKGKDSPLSDWEKKLEKIEKGK